MSKKVLLFCASLAGVCLAADEVVSVPEQVEVPQTEVVVPTPHELPGIRIDQGPVVVEPSYGCSEENIEALAHATVQSLHATLSDVAATVAAEPAAPQEASEQATDDQDQATQEDHESVFDHAKTEITEAVDAVSSAVEEIKEAFEAVGDVISAASDGVAEAQEKVNTEGYVPAIINFISSYYSWFVEFFKQGWKYMVYNSVNRATRHIVFSTAHRSPVDLSALAQVNDFAVDCFSKMSEAKMAILAAAEQRSPQLRHATELYLQSYENWFKGTADAFVDLTATRAMLDSLGVKNIDASAFSTRNLEHFKSRGGDVRHSNLFLVVSPGEIAKYEPVAFDSAPAQD